MNASTPSLEALREVCEILKGAHIVFALGGSGLLAYHGLETEVRDWDITTDASWDLVEPLVRHLDHQLIGPNGIFATKYLCKISLLGASIDLMGEFALKTSDGVHRVATIVTGEWNGIPLGSLEVWAKVYELMGRKENASRLTRYS